MSYGTNGTIPLEDVKSLSVDSYKVSGRELEYESYQFCKKYSLAQRQQMCEKVKAVNPGALLVVLHLAKTTLNQLYRHLRDAENPYARLLVFPDARTSDLVVHARRLFKSELPENSGVFLYCCRGSTERIVALASPISEYVDVAKGPDGLLHFVVTVEAVFGST